VTLGKECPFTIEDGLHRTIYKASEAMVPAIRLEKARTSFIEEYKDRHRMKRVQRVR
jgi:hypothetical protein